MKATNERISELIFKLLKQQATGAEQAELEAWRQSSPEHAVFIDKILKEGFVPQGLRELEQARQKSSERLANQSVPLFTESSVVPIAHRVHFLKTSWFRYASAIVLVAGATVVAVLNSRHDGWRQQTTTSSYKQI
jgi:transmembrane sensor